MAFLTGRLYDGDDSNNDDENIDIAEQPTEKLPRPLASLAIAEAQRMVSECSVTREWLDASELIADYPYNDMSLSEKTDCPLCCMDREEKMKTFVTTDGKLLLICDYHIEQINNAPTPEALDLIASILHVAYLRYSWPPGYWPDDLP